MSAAAGPGGSSVTLVDLAQSLAERFGAQGPSGTPRLPEAIAGPVASSPAIVLLLLDGVGSAPLGTLRPDGALSKFRVGEISSVFPTSTAPALTALATGLYPLAHGNPGWFVWSERLARVVRSLPLDVRGRAGEAVDPAELWSWRPLSARVSAPMAVIQPRAIADSAFTRFAYAGAERRGYDSLDAIPAIVADCLARGCRYVYVYCPEFDACAHANGCGSEAAAQVLARLDALFDELRQALAGSGSLLLATADHGFIDVPAARQLQLDDFPAVARLLDTPLSGEPRVGLARVPPSRAREFEATVHRDLGFAVALHRADDLIARGWFGPPAAANCADRLGSHVLLCRDGWTLVDRVDGESLPSFVGMHGGPCADERWVPLCAARAGRSLAVQLRGVH